MRKKNLGHSALYTLFGANVVYAVRHGFSWLFWVACALTGAVLIFDLLEVFSHE